MKPNHRTLLLVVGLLVVLMLASACVAPAPAPAPAPAQPAAEEAEAPAEAEPTEAEAPSLEGAEIVATYMQSGTYDVGAEALKSGFEEATGIGVELVFAPWDVLNQNHITDLTTGTGAYDVMSGEFWIATVFEHMLPLDEYVERDNFGETYIPGIWSPGPSNFYDGKRIGVPYSADAYGIWYNTEVFEECGVEANWETWDDYIAVLDTLAGCLEGSDVSPMVHYFGQIEQPAAIFLGMYDGYLVDKDGNYGLDREKAVEALNKMQGLLEYNPEGVLGFDFNAGNAVFLNGQAATMVGWPSFIRADADDPEKSQVVGKWALANYPGPGFPMVSAWNMFISKYSENPDAAWEWIKAYANPINGKKWMAEFSIGSPFKATYEDPELVEEFGHFYPAQAQNLDKAKSLPWTFAAFEAFFRNEGDFHQGTITAEEMLDRVQAEWDEIEVPEALVQLAEAQGLTEQ
jgi:ABC-type glycerol-3-phosphate transport system substrate-binding protein